VPARYVPRHGRPPAPASPRRRGARPARRGPAQPALAGLLTAAVVGGTAALAAAEPARPSAAVQTAALVQAPAERPANPPAGRPLVTPGDQAQAAREQALLRASRERAAAPAPVPPAPAPPAPPPPPPVLPGCEGRPTAQYANGRIPASALCEIPGTDHRLRADAARALVLLSQAYRAQTGAELCLTDSYRSYEAQVRAKRAKPRLTAAPGRSNHGTGIAADLCGGVESFRTGAHRWMQANAGRFGWVHPSWAGPRGKRPEPWHWEFRG
jgi:hypothetical protein